MCTRKIKLPIPGWASIADFLIAENEEKAKKGVLMVSKNSPIIAGLWKGVPKGTSDMS